jgi:hypothetical protein
MKFTDFLEIIKLNNSTKTLRLRMHALFLLLVDHVSKTKKWKYFTLLFSLVLTSPKSIFAKDKCKGKPQICFKKQTDHDSPQYYMNMYIRIC